MQDQTDIVVPLAIRPDQGGYIRVFWRGGEPGPERYIMADNGTLYDVDTGTALGEAQSGLLMKRGQGLFTFLNGNLSVGTRNFVQGSQESFSAGAPGEGVNYFLGMDDHTRRNREFLINKGRYAAAQNQTPEVNMNVGQLVARSEEATRVVTFGGISGALKRKENGEPAGAPKEKINRGLEIAQGTFVEMRHAVLVYEKFMSDISLSDEESMGIVDNALQFQKLIITCFNVRTEAYRLANIKEGQLDPTKIKARFYKYTGPGKATVTEILVTRAHVRDLWNTVWESNVHSKHSLNKKGKEMIVPRFRIQTLWAIQESQLNAVLYKGAAPLMRRGLVGESFINSEGLGVPRRLHSIMPGAIGVATQIMRMLDMNDERMKMREDGKLAIPWEKAVGLLKNTVTSKSLKALVETLKTGLGTQETKSTLQFVNTASIALVPSVTPKAVLPVSMVRNYMNANPGMDTFNHTQALPFSMWNASRLTSTVVVKDKRSSGRGADIEGETGTDKSQALMMGCFGLAHEDMGVIEALTHGTFKPRRAMRVQTWKVPAPMNKKVVNLGGLSHSFTHWAPLTRATGQILGGLQNAGMQIATTHKLAVERKAKTEFHKVLGMLKDVDKEGTDAATLKKQVRALIAKVKEDGNEVFKGKKAYAIQDTDGKTPISVQMGNSSAFFFLSNNEDNGQDGDDF